MPDALWLCDAVWFAPQAGMLLITVALGDGPRQEELDALHQSGYFVLTPFSLAIAQAAGARDKRDTRAFCAKRGWLPEQLAAAGPRARWRWLSPASVRRGYKAHLGGAAHV